MTSACTDSPNLICVSFNFFFFNDTATTEIYTLSLHDALPISCGILLRSALSIFVKLFERDVPVYSPFQKFRSEEHTSELQSRPHLVCRLLLEKKKMREIGTNFALLARGDDVIDRDLKQQR